MTTEQMDWLDDERAGRHEITKEEAQALLPGVAKQNKMSKRAKYRAAMHTGEFTPAQLLMREEMTSESSLYKVLADTFGPDTQHDPFIKRLALQLIESDQELVLGIKQWAAVTRLVEDAILLGISLEDDGIIPGL